MVVCFVFFNFNAFGISKRGLHSKSYFINKFFECFINSFLASFATDLELSIIFVLSLLIFLIFLILLFLFSCSLSLIFDEIDSDCNDSKSFRIQSRSLTVVKSIESSIFEFKIVS